MCAITMKQNKIHFSYLILPLSLIKKSEDISWLYFHEKDNNNSVFISFRWFHRKKSPILFTISISDMTGGTTQVSMYVDTCKYTSQLESVIKEMKGIILTRLYKTCLCLLLVSSQLRIPFTHWPCTEFLPGKVSITTSAKSDWTVSSIRRSLNWRYWLATGTASVIWREKGKHQHF